MSQLAFEDMPQRLFACTPSRLAAFDCPRRYRFTYLERPAPPRGRPWAHNVVGATAHVALYRWWLLPRSQRTPDEGASLVERHWVNRGFRDDAQSFDACIATAGWISAYLETVDPADEPVGVERTVAACTERLAVSGRVDRIDDRDGRLVVVDYKTGRRVPSDDDAGASQALALYLLAVRRTLRRNCERVELHHLPTGTVAAFEHAAESLERHVDRAERTADDIAAATAAAAAGTDADEAFPPTPSSSCAWCDFRTLCPEGRAASPDVPAWAGLAGPLGDQRQREQSEGDQSPDDQNASSSATSRSGFSTAAEWAAPGTTA